ncbi:MAG TPA: metal/formaldehyde-sensitive transcriptional repressor [Clostridia bacterium]|nr:metal/formaldehyde-sensitive transcriptional repressor [Clostridia bacterium]
MAHTSDPKERLLNRVRRIRGQVEAIERALNDSDNGCADILCLIAASRGAMNSLMAELIEQHVRDRVLDASNDRARSAAADELLEVVNAYLK